MKSDTPHGAALPLPPGRFGLPLLGESYAFLFDPKRFTAEHRPYGPIFKTHLFGRPTVMMSGAEAMQFVFSHDRDHFAAAWPASTTRLLGEGSISIQEGDIHRRRRKILQEVFGREQIAAGLAQIHRIAQIHIVRWAQAGSFAWSPRMNALTFHIACALILGDESQVEELLESFQDLVSGLFTIPVALPGTPFYKAVRGRQRVLARVEELARTRQSAPIVGQDALSVLLRATDEHGAPLPLAEVKDQILTLLFAGYETTSSALTSLCMLLAQHPAVLARLRAEQAELDRQSPPTIDDMKRMPYLDQVMKEVLRFLPPVGGGFRKVVKECSFHGYRIPAGWSLLYAIGSTHADGQAFADVDRFDPERFGPARAEDKKTRFAFVPFGGGPRVCLGMEYARLEMAVLSVLLCRSYRWELVPGQDLSTAPGPTPRPRSGLQVRFSPL